MRALLKVEYPCVTTIGFSKAEGIVDPLGVVVLVVNGEDQAGLCFDLGLVDRKPHQIFSVRLAARFGYDSDVSDFKCRS